MRGFRFWSVFIAIHFATHGFVLRTASLRPKLNIPPPTKKKSIGTQDQEPITSVLLVCTLRHGGHVGGQEQKHISPLGC